MRETVTNNTNAIETIKRYLEYGNEVLLKEDCKIPVLRIKVMEQLIHENGEEDEPVNVENGYLSPFRKYRFQVSGTENGQGDFGSTEVVGLRHLTEAQFPNESGWGYNSNIYMEKLPRELLRWGMCTAVSEYASRVEAIPPRICPFSQEEADAINEFLTKTIEFINCK